MARTWMLLVLQLMWVMLWPLLFTDAYDDDLRRYYFTDNCDSIIGPTHGAVLHYHTDHRSNYYRTHNESIDCDITWYNRHAYDSNQSHVISMKFRNDYYSLLYDHNCTRGDPVISSTHNDTNVTQDCVDSGAYIQVFDDYVYLNPEPVATFCGIFPPAIVIQTSKPFITIRLHIDPPPPAPENGTTTYNVTSVYNTTTTDTNSTTSSVSSTTSSASSTTSSASSTGFQTTTNVYTTMQTTPYGNFSNRSAVPLEHQGTRIIAIAPPRNYLPSYHDNETCGVNFTIDLTSFFYGGCSSDGHANDYQQFQCKDTKCMAVHLRCDRYYSDNCWDYSDQIYTWPAFCPQCSGGGGAGSGAFGGGVVTSAAAYDDLLWLWILLGLLLGFLVLYWCCWRPGWFIWCMGRLRNCNCCIGNCCGTCFACGCLQGCAGACCMTSAAVAGGCCGGACGSLFGGGAAGNAGITEGGLCGCFKGRGQGSGGRGDQFCEMTAEGKGHSSSKIGPEPIIVEHPKYRHADLNGDMIGGGAQMKSLLWTCSSGQKCNIRNATNSQTRVDGLALGTYKYLLTGVDMEGKVHTVSKTVLVKGAAPPDMYVAYQPNMQLFLREVNGRGGGAGYSHIWTCSGGPSKPIIMNTDEGSATMMEIDPGTYHLECSTTAPTGVCTTSKQVIHVIDSEEASGHSLGPLMTMSGSDTSVVLKGPPNQLESAGYQHSWSCVSGPNEPSMPGTSGADISVGHMEPGFYNFQCITTPPNGEPVARMQLVQMTGDEQPTAHIPYQPGVQVFLNNPPNQQGNTSKPTWTCTGGPTSPTITNTDRPTEPATITDLQPGTYNMECTTSPSAGSQPSTLKQPIHILGTGVAPPNSLGPVITMPPSTNEVHLKGPHNQPETEGCQHAWTCVSGPVYPNMGDPSTSDVIVDGMVPGVYNFQCVSTAPNGQPTVSTQVVQVPDTSYSTLPAQLGEPIEVPYPASQAVLSGPPKGPGRENVIYTWKCLDGPMQPQIDGSDKPSSTAFGLQPGAYKFQLTATNPDGSISAGVQCVTVRGQDSETLGIYSQLSTSAINAAPLLVSQSLTRSGNININGGSKGNNGIAGDLMPQRASEQLLSLKAQSVEYASVSEVKCNKYFAGPWLANYKDDGFYVRSWR